MRLFTATRSVGWVNKCLSWCLLGENKSFHHTYSSMQLLAIYARLLLLWFWVLLVQKKNVILETRHQEQACQLTCEQGWVFRLSANGGLHQCWLELKSVKPTINRLRNPSEPEMHLLNYGLHMIQHTHLSFRNLVDQLFEYTQKSSATREHNSSVVIFLFVSVILKSRIA